MLPRRLLYAGRLQTDGQQWMYIGTSWMCHGSVTLTRMLYAVRIVLHCVSKNGPTLASCSVDKRRLILIIFGKQHQRTFKNYMRVQLSSSLHFYLLYLQPFHIWPLACQKWANTAWWKLRRLKTCKTEWTVRVMQENKSGCVFFSSENSDLRRAVLCVSGDAYRYTIQPVFQNIKTEFQCHVHLQRPHDVLYELFFFIQIPGIVIIGQRVVWQI